MPSSTPTSIMVVTKRSTIKAATRVEEEEEEDNDDDDDNVSIASLTWGLSFPVRTEMNVNGFWSSSSIG